MKKNIEKRSGLFKILSLMIMMVFIAPVMVNAQQGKTDFSGNWVMNAEKSSLPQGNNGGNGAQRMGGGNLVVKQEANLLTVDRTRQGRDGQPATTTMKYSLDGKESVNTSPRGDSKSVASWSSDGKTLTINTNRNIDMNGQSKTMKTTEVWTLSDAGTLSVKTTMPRQNEETTM